MISRREFWNVVESLPVRRFHFLLVHLLGINIGSGNEKDSRELTWGDLLRLRLADRLSMLGVSSDAQFSMLKAWDGMLGAAGEIWAEERADDVEYDHVFFSVSNFRLASMPYSKDRKFYDTAEEKWIDELGRPVEIIISIDLYELMYGLVRDVNARRAEDGEEPIVVGQPSEVANS